MVENDQSTSDSFNHKTRQLEKMLREYTLDLFS